MSTRAILGVVQNDGSFLGAWQWNDGGDILELLNRKFVDNASVKELLSLGMWSSMGGPRQFKAFYNQTIKDVGYESKLAESVKSAIKLSNDVYFIKESYCTNSPKVYKNVKDALEEDINYIYVYFPGLYKWKKYSNFNALKKDGLV